MLKIEKRKRVLFDIDKKLRELKKEKEKQKITKVVTMLKNNPDLIKEMINSELREVFGIAKREYKKQIIEENRKKIK